MIKFQIGTVAAAWWMTLATGAQAQQVDMAHSELSFVTHQMGVPVEGRFKQWDAQLAFDPRKPEAAMVALRMDVGSITFAAPEVAAEAQRSVWLDVAHHAQASFQSTSVKAVGSGRYEMTGRLNLKGQMREVVVPVNLVQAGRSGTATGNFTINRMAFRVGDGEWADPSLVAHDVQVRFKVALTGLVAP